MSTNISYPGVVDNCSAFKVLLGVGDLVWASTGDFFSNSAMLLLKAGQLLWNRGLLFWIESLLRNKRLVWLSTKENSTLIMLCQLYTTGLVMEGVAWWRCQEFKYWKWILVQLSSNRLKCKTDP